MANSAATAFAHALIGLLPNPRKALVALFIAGAWETFWLWLLSEPYMKLNHAQYNCHLRLIAQAPQRPQWMLLVKLWICAILRFIIKYWITGKWIFIIALGVMEAEALTVQEIFLKLRIPQLLPLVYNIALFCRSKMKQGASRQSRSRSQPAFLLSTSTSRSTQQAPSLPAPARS